MEIFSSVIRCGVCAIGDFVNPEKKEVRPADSHKDSPRGRDRFFSAVDQAILVHRILCANRDFSSVRVKRAVSERAAESSVTTGSNSLQCPSSQQELRLSVPEIKNNPILNMGDPVLNNMRPAQPTCSRLQNNSRPNPPAPPGYSSWEKFLASDPDVLSSDRDDISIKNPSQELARMDREEGIILRKFEALYQENINWNIYDKFKKDLTCSLIDRGEVEAKFRNYKRDIHNASLGASSKMYLRVNELKLQMCQELTKVRYGKSNRWIDGEGWNSTPNAGQWQQEWQNQYLPKARQAVWDVAMPNYLDETEFKTQRNKWISKGSVALQQLAARKGWSPFVIPRE